MAKVKKVEDIPPTETAAIPAVSIEKSKRKMTDAQKANLAKGQAVMKEMAAKRAEIANRNKIKDAKRTLGEPVSSDDEDVPSHPNKGIPRPRNTTAKARSVSPQPTIPPVYKLVVPRKNSKPQKPRNYATKDDLAEIKTMLGKLIIPPSEPAPSAAPPSPVAPSSPIKPAPTANAVAVRRLSGTGFLDNLFFNK